MTERELEEWIDNQLLHAPMADMGEFVSEFASELLYRIRAYGDARFDAGYRWAKRRPDTLPPYGGT